MSQSEDYLDNLLNSIGKAKTDAEQIRKESQARKDANIRRRTAVSYDEDFLTATGINNLVDDMGKMNSHPLLRQAFSEDDFLRDFENELLEGDTDDFINNFEMEIDEEERIFQETGEIPDANSVVDALLNNIDNKVSKAQEEQATQPEDDGFDYGVDDDSDAVDDSTTYDDTMTSSGSDSSEDFDSSEFPDFEEPEEFMQEPLMEKPIVLEDPNEIEDEEDEIIELTSEDTDDEGLGSLDDLFSDQEVDIEPLNDEDGDGSSVMDEFQPDEMDARDEEEYNASDDEPDLADELDDLNILDGDDLMDIDSLLSEEGEQLDIDEEVEGTSSSDGDEKGKKAKKEKKPKGSKEKKPLPPALQKLLLIIFGPPEEEDPEEIKAEALKKAEKIRKKNPGKLTDEQKALFAEAGNPVTDQEIADFEKKKEEKKEAKKEEKAKEEKPKKPPKPKKPKKQKEPDNSPKIPLSIIGTFLVLSISIIGVVILGMTYMGNIRHLAQARELFENGDYVLAYEKLNGLELTKEDDILARNQSRILADLQQCTNEYNVFIEQGFYDLALDALIRGTGRYEKYKDEAATYGVSEQYDAYMQQISNGLSEKFDMTTDDALYIFNQKNRHYYSVELRKVLIKLGLEEK